MGHTDLHAAIADALRELVLRTAELRAAKARYDTLLRLSAHAALDGNRSSIAQPNTAASCRMRSPGRSL